MENEKEEKSTNDTSKNSEDVKNYSDSPSFKICKNVIVFPANCLEINEVIGEGGCGLVKAARYKTINFALKTSFNCLNKRSEEDLRSTIKEVNVLKHLRHQNIPIFYGLYNTENENVTNQKFNSILIERIMGDNMQEMFNKNSSMNTLMKIKFCIDIGKVLCFIHNNHIIHRDFKPNNIMIDNKLNVKILDFGISKMAKSTMPTENPRCGTVLYFSPEHAEFIQEDNGENIDIHIEISKKIDIWALGLIINQLFSGDLPWKEKGIRHDNAFKVLIILMQKTPFMVSQKITNKDIIECVKNCTLNEKQERYSAEKLFLHFMFSLYNLLRNKENRRKEIEEFFSFKEYSAISSK